VDTINSQKTQTTYRAEYRGNGEGLFGLCLQNFILRVLTLNIYYPWAKTEFRKHVWANTFFLDQALVYRGLGMEIFKGFLKVIGIYVGYSILNFLATKFFGQQGTIAMGVAGALLFFFLVPRMILGSYRYRLTRTTWRGVRFGLKPIEKQFTWELVKGVILSILTLGIYLPFWYRQLYLMRIEATNFGNICFRYSGDKGDEFLIFLKGFLLSIITLGIYQFWFMAELSRYRFSHTHFGEAVLARDLTGWDFVKMYFFCGLALVFTLGLAYPWVFTYRLRLIASRTAASGLIDFEAITQSALAAGASGEAATDFFGLDDIGFSFDL